MLLNDKVQFRMHWPQHAELKVNGIAFAFQLFISIIVQTSDMIDHMTYEVLFASSMFEPFFIMQSRSWCTVPSERPFSYVVTI
jgi:hypothetical protein